MIKRITLVATAALLAVGLAACADGVSPTTESIPAAATSNATSDPATAEPTPTVPDHPHVTPMPDAPAGDVVVTLVADGVRWDADELTVPAGETWTLIMDSQDPQFHPHNFTITDGPEFADRIYQTPQLVGPAVGRYEIPGLPAGTYEYICTVLDHQAVMRGTLTVE